MNGEKKNGRRKSRRKRKCYLPYLIPKKKKKNGYKIVCVFFYLFITIKGVDIEIYKVRDIMK